MARELVERRISEWGIDARDDGTQSGRRAAVNLAESPLTWLASRGLLTTRQVLAGERLRADYERAALGPSVTMRWDATRVDGGGASEHGAPTDAMIAAKQRFDAAMATLGEGLTDIAWRVICAGEAMTVAERGLGWPTRSGRIVLGIALDRLAAFYRIG